MVSRSADLGNPLGYRYGFNGKENDADVKGDGNQVDYGMRIYDPRLGKFLSNDPLSRNYPWYTPYQFAGNKPILSVDIDGMEENSRSTYLKPIVTTFAVNNTYEANLQSVKIMLVAHNEFGDPKSFRKSTVNFFKIGETTFALPQGISPQTALNNLYDRYFNLESGRFADVSDIKSYESIFRGFVWHSRYDQREREREEWAEAFNDGAVNTINTLALIGGPVQALHEDLAMMPKGGTSTSNGALVSEANLTGEEITRISVNDKLYRYVLNKEHALGGAKASWFEKALGFTKSNAADLAKQLVFDSKKAIETGKTIHGTKYNQMISIVGANGKTIDVNTVWIQNLKGEINLVSAIPTKK